MTLQKQTWLSTHALILALMLYVSPANNRASGIITNESQNAVRRNVSVASLPVIKLNDSTLKPMAFEKLAKPQIQMNAGAVKFVQQFIKKNAKDLHEMQQRSKAVFDIIEPILSQRDIPQQLKYLAVVESDLKSCARSKAGAVGLWQLMGETARELGLKVAGKTDERKQQSKSTKAAAKYLKVLYKEYGDWLLVIAAYNSGPGVVNKAIKKSGSRNFWKLQMHLPGETRGHVKRYIAIHYFFEEAGSETTLTKAENAAYSKELEHYNCVIVESAKALDTSVVADTMTSKIIAANR